MKIIHIVLGKGNPERMNGVNKVAYQLATTQTKLGHDVTLFGIANSLEKNYPERNFKTQLFFQIKNKFTIDVNLKNAILSLSEKTIVHFHGAFIPEFYHVAQLLNKQRIPYIYTPHGSLTEMAMTKNRIVKKLYFQMFESRVIENAKRVQLLGINEFSFLDSLTRKAHKCLIANGQDLSIIPIYTTKEGQNDHPVFGFCGRLATFHKGLDLMIKGFQQYIYGGGKGTLELIGDGNDRKELEQLAIDLDIADRVVFHGKKFGKDKFDLLNRMDIFLHTSRMEGFPTAVLEASALKIPTITSEATNINSFVKEYNCGFILHKNTPEEIGEVMTNAAHFFVQKKLNKMGERGREMVEQEFNWKKIATQLVQVYAA